MRKKNIIPLFIIMILVLCLPAKSSENFSQRIGVGFLSAPFPVFGFSLTYNVTDQIGIQAFGRVAIVDVDFIAGRVLYRFYKTSKFALYAAWHLLFPPFPFGSISYPIKKAWKKACVETESSSVKWAYLRTSGKSWGGTWINTYNERLEESEPSDPVNNRTFYWLNGSC